MNLDELNHSFTPELLGNINQRIVELFKTLPDKDIPTLNTLLQERDNVIKAHMETLNEASLKEFANAELEVNKKLTELAQQWLEAAKDDVTRFVRSQVAIKKYK